MMQLGERLKEARKEKTLTLDDIQQETKIQKRYLVAIENNEWSKIPGIFYARAFIREYASAVGLNGDDLLNEHKDELPQSDEKKYEYAAPSRRSRQRGNKVNKSVFMFIPRLLVVLLVIAVLFGIYYYYITSISPPADDEEERPDIVTAPDTEPEDPVDDEEEEEEQEQELPVEDEEPEVVEQTITVVEVDEALDSPRSIIELSNSDSFELTFEVTDETYLWVRGLDENNQVLNSHFESMFSNSDSPMTIDVSDENRVEINVGRASSTTIYINDEEFEFPVDPNERVHQFITIIWDNDEE